MTQPSRSRAASRWTPIFLGLFAASVVGGGVWWLRRDRVETPPREPKEQVVEPAPPKPAPPSEAYVGNRACRVCHSDIANMYDGHTMANSAALVSEAPALEDYTTATRFSKGGCDYRVELADDGVYHHESYTDAQGELFDQRVEVQYSVGSGHRGRSYFIDRGGLLFMSPISWYSQQNRWDLSPNFPDQNHPRFERPVTGRCLGCHAGRVNHEPGENDRFTHPAVRESAISCERCHGPGRDHVSWHRGGDSRTGDDPIINPKKLSPSKREGVCNQCHLIGTDEVLRYGRTDFDFRPGMEIGDVWSIFVEGTGVSNAGETTAVSQVQQMRASRCFIGSEGKLGCITCHDSHRLPTSDTRLVEYNTRCQNCHTDRGCSLPSAEREAAPANGSCIDCHMPRLGANDVPHTTQTDHRVLRRPQSQTAEESSAVGKSREPVTRIFDLEEVPLDAFDLNRALGIVEAIRAEYSQNAERAARAVSLLEPVSKRDPTDSAVADKFGISLAISGDPDRAVDTWQRALFANTKSEGLLYSIGLAYSTRGRHAEALPYFNRLTQVNPWRTEYQAQRSRVLLANGKTEEAIEAAKRVTELNPAMAAGWEWLAFICEQDGRPIEAERYRKIQKRNEKRTAAE
ncbi:MAG: tetratricopeptide repeat protein [Planctomycetota bacterium]|nr:tetratricopeptide repeat protein [Planctomycetota bacterium]